MTRVAHIPYLESRRAGFLFRRRIPCRLRSSNLDPADFLCLSLRTHVPADAKELARRLTALCDLAFALATETGMDHLGNDDIKLLEALARFQIDAHAAARAMAAPRSEAAAMHAAACERATQEVLRRALALGDREVARHPLREVAARLGATLSEDTDSWRALAFEATRILLDVSRERERRELGQFDEVSPIFRSARDAGAGTVLPSATAPATIPIALPLAPPPPGVGSVGSSSGLAAPFGHAAPGVAAVAATLEPMDGCDRVQARDAASAPVVEPPSMVAKGRSDDDIAVRARLRPPKLDNIDLRDLSEESRAALAKPRGITITQGIRLFCDLKEAGYSDDFSKKQLADPVAGQKWQKDSSSKIRFAERFWPEFLGDLEVEKVEDSDLRDALAFLPLVPAKHGKGQEKYLAENGYRELVEHIDSEEESDAEANLQALEGRSDVTEADREQALRDARHPRLRTETIVKHRRTILAVGQMLYDLQLIDTNPFAICSVSNKDRKRMAANEESRTRTVWDDRIYDLFRSRVFQGDIEEPGDPLFWLPLLARLNGLREEEACQLAPEDFGTDRGIAYLDVKACDANHVKTAESQRRIPVHPQLIELGLLQLVEMRRRQRKSRLFPHLTRGQTKGKFSENFSKKFTYYRKTNDCYWPGLDFHAFRTTFHGDLMNRDKSDAIRCRLAERAESPDDHRTEVDP